MEANIQISQELIRELFDYKDGFLYRKVTTNNRAKAGKKVKHRQKSKNGYRYTVRINYKLYLCSRLIFLWHHGWLPEIVDHENRISDDDRIENLRAANISENGKNSTSRIGSSSKYLGVNWNKNANKWVAKINFKKSIHLGYHKTQELAAMAYNKAAVKYHKEFANLNIIQPI